MEPEFNKCALCPRRCLVNRNKGELGFCKASSKIVVARAALHYWEEPCISGNNGSGTIFFSYCNLKCVFCQNYDISTLHKGKEITVSRLAAIYLELQEKGANNINLVTPTHYIPVIRSSLILAKKQGLTIPIVYNSSGYERVEALKLLEGLIDVYLPDFKYCTDSIAIKYSNCPNYFEVTKEALKEMYRQVGSPLFDDKGIMVKGMIVRHLMLPNMEEDSKKIIKYLYDTYKDNIYLSIMNQYTPLRKLPYEELNRKVDNLIYDEVIEYAYDLGVRKAFVQDDETQSESFIPDFNNNIGV